MKKIITAAAIAAMAASFAAAEVKVSVNYKTGIQALEHTLEHDGVTDGTRVLSNFTSNRTTADALTFKGSAEYGGLELEIDPTVKGNATDADLKEGNGKYITLEKYNAWINFGNFTLKSGTWDKRAVGRVNADAGNHEGKFWGEINKPGLATTKGVAKLGVDISQQNGKKTQTTMVEYNNKDLGLEARVAYLDKDGTTTTFANGEEGGDWVFANETWFAEVGYKINGVGRILATTKLSHKDYAAALFLEPKLADLPALTSLVGFTAETKTNAGKDKGDDVAANAFALDLRARYNLGDFVEGLSATVMYNWTFGNDATAAGEKPGYYATWAMLNLTYKLNGTFTPFLSLGWSNATECGKAGKAAYFDDPLTYSLRTYAGVEIYNTKNANLITGICWDAADMTNQKGACVKTVSVPVLMKVKF